MGDRILTTLGAVLFQTDGSIKTGPFGTVLKAAEYSASGVPLISVGEVGYGSLRVHGKTPRINEAIIERLPHYVLRSGDIVFGRKGAVDRSAWVRPHEDGYFLGSDGIRVRVGNGLSSRFLAYQFQLEATRTWLLQHASGTTMLSLNQTILERVPVVLPDIGEQEAIAKVLSAIDDKIAANERIARTARELGDQLFAVATAEVEGVPTTIGELSARCAIEFSDGYRTKKAEHGKPGLRILRAGDVRESYVYPSGDDYVSEDYSRQIGSKASMPGDIVLTTKGTVGRVAVVAEGVERVVYSPQVCYFRMKDDSQVEPGYLGAWFRSSDLQQQAATLMYKSDMAPYISLRDIRSLVVPLPSIEEQHRIGEVQRNLFAAFDASRVENERLTRTRDELLPLLMSGTVQVKHAEAIVSEVV